MTAADHAAAIREALAVVTGGGDLSTDTLLDIEVAADAALDALLAELQAARAALDDVRAILDAYSGDDVPGASLVALGKIGDRMYREVTGV